MLRKKKAITRTHTVIPVRQKTDQYLQTSLISGVCNYPGMMPQLVLQHSFEQLHVF